jgi:hypothetical protein
MKFFLRMWCNIIHAIITNRVKGNRILYFLSFVILFLSCIRPKYDSHKISDNLYGAIDHFIEPYAAKKGMKVVLIGPPTETYDVNFGFLLSSSNRMNLPQGRLLAYDVFDHFFHMLQKSPEVDALVEYYNTHYKNYPGCTSDQICFRIDFWDEKVDRIMPPHLGQILVEKNTFYYYEADPKTLVLRLVHQDIIEEAEAFFEAQRK